MGVGSSKKKDNKNDNKTEAPKKKKEILEGTFYVRQLIKKYLSVL